MIKHKTESIIKRNLRNRFLKRYKTWYIIATSTQAQFKYKTTNFSVYLPDQSGNDLITDIFNKLLINSSQMTEPEFIILHKQAQYPIEQTPNIESIINLNNDQLDALGVPKVDLHWAITPENIYAVHKSARILAVPHGLPISR